MDWKIWYSDESTFSSEDGSWEEAPARGVLFLVTADPEVGREVDRGQEFYIWWPDATKPWGVDYAGLWDYLIEVDSDEAHQTLSTVDFDALAENHGVKFGRSVDNLVYRRIYQQAISDPDFPVKSGKTQRELTPPDRVG